jgi:hypothetical protein
MRKPRLLIWAAWLVHALAWFLPVITDGVSLPEGLPGWQAFRVASSALWPYRDFHSDAWFYAALATLSALTTLAFIIGSPWVVLRGSSSLQRVCAWTAAGAFIVNAHWYVFFGLNKSGLRMGYFLWWFSFLLLAIGLFNSAERNEPEA